MQLIFIRHAEKTKPEPRHLNHVGRLRARFLVDYFNHPYDEFTRPTHAYIMQMPSHKSQRCIETMQPLIHANCPSLRYELVPRYETHQLAARLLDTIRTSQSETASIVCWQHSRIVDMLTTLGADVTAWGLDPDADGDDKDCFNATWVVCRVKHMLRLDVYRQFDIVDDQPVYTVPRNKVLFSKTWPIPRSSRSWCGF